MKQALLRLQLHERGREALRLGAYDQAFQTLQEGLDHHGPHVGLLADLAGAAYLRGHIAAFQLLVERLEAEFQKALPLLSRESLLRTHITLGKFFEETGRVAEAFDQIDAALALLEPGDPLSFQARAQKLRLLASFGRETETGLLYHQCLQISEHHPEAWIECFHACLLAEVRLFGFATVWPRLTALLKSPELQAADPRLLIFDLIEIAFETGRHEYLPELLALAEASGETDPYESELLRLARAPRGQALPEEFFQWNHRLAPLAALKLMALHLADTTVPEAQESLRKQLTFRLHAFDARTRRLFLDKWGAILSPSEVLVLQLDPQRKELRREGLVVSFARSTQSWSLLKAVLADSAERHPQAIAQAWLGRPATAQDLETLRIALLRLERKIVSQLQLDWFCRYSKEEIKRNPRVQVRSRFSS